MRKSKNTRALLFIVPGFIMITALLIFLVLPKKLDHTNFGQKTEFVSGIGSGGAKDMVITIKDDATTYYINRGFEAKSNPEALKKRISGQEVVIYYNEPTAFSAFLATGKPSVSIRKLILKNTVVYSESGT